jgi:hypothetical protein
VIRYVGGLSALRLPMLKQEGRRRNGLGVRKTSPRNKEMSSRTAAETHGASLRSRGSVLQLEIKRKGAGGPINILNAYNIGSFPGLE